MDLNQIQSTLQEMFNKPLENEQERRVTFWEDQKKEFVDDWDSIILEGVKLYELTNDNQFHTKFLLEVEDVGSGYLIYSNLNLESKENWLLDTVLYSQIFKASRIDLIMNELGIDGQLRPVLERYATFFNNKARYNKFKNYSGSIDTEYDVEVRMISTLCRLNISSFERAVRVILIESLKESNKYLKKIEKFFDLDRFWTLVERQYGYVDEEKSLRTFFMHLTVSALSFKLNGEELPLLENLIALNDKANCYLFIDHWMQNQTEAEVFKGYARQIEQELNLKAIFAGRPIENYAEADIFPVFDEAIIYQLANDVLNDLEDYDQYLSVIENRRSKYYFNQYESMYNLLFYAVKIHQFKKEYDQGLPSGMADSIFKAYVESYYRMDYFYRKFYLAYDKCEKYEFVNKLQTKVEHLYTNWFMAELGVNWTYAVQADLASKWSLPGVKRQQDFYKKQVSPRIESGERVFVIISDAMRYEVATELSGRLETETIGSTHLEGLLGIVPSITKLGMASLLPYKSLDVDESGKVIVDGNPVEGYGARKKFIEGKVDKSLVYKSDDYMALSRTDKAAVFKGHNLIYIYHDTIDAIGDNAATENRVFSAVDQSVSELFELINSVRNDLSGTNIYITADHGFLYQRSPLPENEKIANDLSKPVNYSRRYALSQIKQDLSGQINMELGTVFENANALQLYMPNGSIRNRVQGPGANFVHGGASLQEIVIPLISYKNKRASQKGVEAIEKVNIVLTSQTRTITNKLFTLQFFQSEKVKDKIVPRTVHVYMEDESGKVITNVETIIADKVTNSSEERMFAKQFTLENLKYNRHESYYLVIKDLETGVYTDKIPFQINLGIINDFF